MAFKLVFVKPFAWASQVVVPHWALGGVGRGISHTRPLRCKHLEMIVMVMVLLMILMIFNQKNCKIWKF